MASLNTEATDSLPGAPSRGPQGSGKSTFRAISDAIALALPATIVVGIVDAIRTARGGGNIVDGLIIALALVFPLAVLASWLIDQARAQQHRLLAQGRAKRIVIAASLAVIPLLILGTLLKAKTHHRGLGGATFGIFGIAIVGAAAVVSQRLSPSPSGSTVGAADEVDIPGLSKGGLKRYLPWLAGGMALLVLIAPIMFAGGEDGPLARATLLDVLLLAGASFAARHARARDLLDRIRPFVVPAMCVVLVLGIARLEWSQSGTAVRAGGGLAGSVASALEGWTDRDGDGRGAHFGGQDCDEGDPGRHPGAADPKGDAIDSNCDGVDGIASTDPDPSAVATIGAGAADPAQTGSATAPAVPDSPEPSNAGPPDIIVVTLDTVRADRTSAYGFEKNTTPHLSSLAKRGLLFEHAYAPGTSTQRALLPVVTGKSFDTVERSRSRWPTIQSEANTVAERVKQKGYRTAAITTFTWLRKDRGFGQGFDVFDEEAWREHHPERKSTSQAAIGRAMVAHKTLAEKDGPIFMWVHLFDAHADYLSHEGFSYGSSKSDRYNSEIAFVDSEVGKLIDAVGKTARANRTLWVIHGSHGEGFGEHDATGHGTHLYEEMLRVPLVIAGPGVDAARASETAVSTMDIAPTVVALAGADATGVEGVSLVPAFRNSKTWKRPAVTAVGRNRYAVIDWPLKVIVRKRSRSDRHLLFDLSVDPKEQHDISAKRDDDIRRLKNAKQG